MKKWISVVLMSLSVLTGCQGKTFSSEVSLPSVAEELVVPVAPAETAAPESIHSRTKMARLEQCRQELEVIQSLGSESKKRYQQAFDGLMQEVSRYSGLRAGVGADTQETVDALYQYRVNRLCAEIHLALLTGLAERGEQVK